MLRLPARRPSKSRGTRKSEVTPGATKGNMQVRVVSVAALVAIVFVILAVRLWYLQVLTGEDYADSAQKTRTLTVKQPAQRGVIYDRDGEVLATNGPGLNVTVIPSSISRKKVEELAGILGADKETVLQRYDVAVENNPYSAMLVKENADQDDVTYVIERTDEFPDVTVNDDYIRSYPNGGMAAHLLGYTGAITEDELNREPFKNLSNDAIVGKGGVELAYEKELRGKAGKKEYSVDALGRVVTLRRADGSRADGRPEVSPVLGEPDRIVDPEPGKDLALTVDLELQQTAEAELDAAITRAQTAGYSGTGGAVVALDPRNGQIQAMASRPDFDPQLFVGGISGAEEMETFQYLNSEVANAPFANRVIGGAYPAASTFKVFTGMAGLAYDVITPSTTVTDSGDCWLPAGVEVGCWLSWRQTALGIGASHGTQNYAQALMDSNDKYFYQVADWIWNRTNDENLLPEYYERFGFGSPTGIDLPGEAYGRVPDSEWQKESGGTPEDKLWSIGRWVNMAIGQGDLLVTPLQLARGYAAIQNGGTLVTPHIGLEIRDQNGNTEKISPEPGGQLELNREQLDATIQGLRMVTGPGGTAESAFEGTPLKVAGKSGTGEIAGKDPVAWFVGWAENQKKPLVVLVMVEGGGDSELAAAPAVRIILEAYHGVGDKDGE